MVRSAWALVSVLLLLLPTACGGGRETAQGQPGGGRPGAGGGPGGMGGPSRPPVAAVPVQVAPVERRAIAGFLETNGTLEAENEVDLVARTSGPITELRVEESQLVARDQLLARIDDREARNQVAIATVTRDEAQRAFDRVRTTFASGLVSQEAHDAALAALQSAEAQLEKAELQLGYTEIRAPFAGLVAIRHIRLAQHVSVGERLFRLSDFTPLLCPVRVPEKDLRRLAPGQPARIRVEAFPGEVFEARVARIRPTVDASTGTITVTLEVNGRGRLQPGMFASVGIRTEVRDEALVIPADALVLDSLGDTVFVREGDAAVRRTVTLGLREHGSVEILSGVEEGEHVVVLGQDGLADGTPITVLDGSGDPPERTAGEMGPGQGPDASSPAAAGDGARRAAAGESVSNAGEGREPAPDREPGSGPGAGRGGGQGMTPGGELPPLLAERIRTASDSELEQIRARMRDRGWQDEQIEAAIRKARDEKP